MTEEQEIAIKAEKNKLIGEFMGVDIYDIGYEGNVKFINPKDSARIITVKYADSWRDLMPVIAKLKPFLHNKADDPVGEAFIHGIEDSLWDDDIASAHEYVVDVIKLYNKENK